MLTEIAQEREAVQVRLTALTRSEKHLEAEKADVLAHNFEDVEEALNAAEVTVAERRQLLSTVGG